MAVSWNEGVPSRNLTVSYDDYSQWERRRSPRALASKGARKIASSSSFPHPGTFQNPRPGGNDDSSRKARFHRSKADDHQPDGAAAQIKLLKFQIRSRKKTIAQYCLHSEELVKLNVALRHEIETLEKDVHSDIDGLLEKYGKFRSAISGVERKFAEDLRLAKERYSQVSEETSKELKRIEDKLTKLQERLSTKTNELTFLRKYKDKVFPVRARRIAELRHQIDALDVSNESVIADLKLIIEKERRRCTEEQKVTEINTKKDAANSALDAMDPSVTEQAMVNNTMKKEIEMHRREVFGLRDDIRRIEENIGILEAEIRDLDMTVHPARQQRKTICLPEMEIKLDIPEQEWLPV